MWRKIPISAVICAMFLTLVQAENGLDCYEAENCERFDVKRGRYCCPSIDNDDGFIVCDGDDFSGKCKFYSMYDKQCVNLDDNDVTSSMNTLDNCFRVYEHINCIGKSRPLLPGSPSHNNMTILRMNEIISSVGRCNNRDYYVRFIRFRRNASARKYEFANELLETGFLAWLRRDMSKLTGPVKFYQLSLNGRTEVMEAHILPQHLNNGTGTNVAARKYARLMGNENDDAGHILAKRLGGSGTDLRNIFPQNAGINRGVWAADVEDLVANAVISNNGIRFTVNLKYHNTNDTRPFELVYCIRKLSNGAVILIGDVVNP